MQNDPEDFLDGLRMSLASATYVRKKSQLMGFIQYLAERKKNYIEIKKGDIEEYLLHGRDALGSKGQKVQVIRDFYNYLQVSPNPAGEIKFLPKAERKKPFMRLPSPEGIVHLIRQTSSKDGILDKRNALMLELAYGSGLRRGELLRLNVEDIDIAGRKALVLGKGNKQRVVPLTKSAIGALKEYLFLSQAIRGPLLRSYRGRRLTGVTVTDIFKREFNMNPHSLRHACAMHMLKRGCNIRYIQKLLGHEGLESTQIYTRMEKGDLQEVIERCHAPSVQACSCAYRVD